MNSFHKNRFYKVRTCQSILEIFDQKFKIFLLNSDSVYIQFKSIYEIAYKHVFEPKNLKNRLTYEIQKTIIL